MYVSVSLTCTSACMFCLPACLVPTRLEDSFESPGTGDTDVVSHHMDAGNFKPDPLGKSLCSLLLSPLSSPLYTI